MDGPGIAALSPPQAGAAPMASGAPSALAVQGGSHSCGGRRALRDVRFEVPRRRSVAAVPGDVGLANRARDKAGQLSSGQMRGMEIARALIHQPSVLTLDKRTTALDAASKTAIMEQACRLARSPGVSPLWPIPLLEETQPGDHVVVLYQGRGLASEDMSGVVAVAGVTDLRSAFRTITGTTPVNEDGA